MFIEDIIYINNISVHVHVDYLNILKYELLRGISTQKYILVKLLEMTKPWDIFFEF